MELNRIIDVLLGERVVAAEVLIKVASRLLMKLESAICTFHDFEVILKTIRSEPRTWNHQQLCTLLSEALVYYRWSESERSVLSTTLEDFERAEGRSCSDLAKQQQEAAHSGSSQQSQEEKRKQEISGSTKEAAPTTNRHSLFSSDVSLEIRRLH